MTDPHLFVETRAVTGPEAENLHGHGTGAAISAWKRLLLALNELAIHMVGALAVVASIEIMEWLIGLMTHQAGVVFFRGSVYFELPARWLFDAADIGILLAILYRGVVVMWQVYREP